MRQQFAYFSFYLLFYVGVIDQGKCQTASQIMKENLGEWVAEVRKFVKELEEQIERMQNREELGNLELRLMKFYLLVRQKPHLNDDPSEHKWNELCSEYSIKFGKNSDLLIRSNKDKHGNLKEILEKITTWFDEFNVDLNTFLVQVDLSSMEQELELYTARMEATSPMNIEEMVDKGIELISKMKKEIAENKGEIYLTERPFEKAENRLIALKSDQKSKIEINDLWHVLDQLMAEVRLEMLRIEFDTNFESVNKNILKQLHHGQAPEWRPFLAVADAFRVDWYVTDKRSGKLSAKDQRTIREQMEQIKKAAQIKTEPLKAMFIDRLKGMAEVRADLELIKADLTAVDVQSPRSLANDQFWDRAIDLCAKLDQIDQRIGILNVYRSPKEFGAKILEFKLAKARIPRKKEVETWLKGTLYEYDEMLGEIEKMVERIEEKKTEFEKAFVGKKKIEAEIGANE